MDIDITDFVQNEETWDFSGSVATHGPNAGPQTWQNALKEATRKPLLSSEDELQALRDHMAGFGAWDDEEIAAWSNAECNALFIQLISGDMRESGMDQAILTYGEDNFDWEEFEERVQEGQISGNIYKSGDRIYYSLGE